jgi:hypothetical protein
MIPFRTQRLATSVVNRILNVYDGLPPRPTRPVPATPDPLPDAQAIEARLTQAQATPVDAAPNLAQEISLRTLLP